MFCIKSGTRASSYFTPKYDPNLLLWLSGADPNGNGVVPANGTAQSPIVDKSKNGYSFSQSISAEKAVNTNNFQNGRNALRFGNGHFDQEDSGVGINLSASFSLLLVFQPLVTAQGYIFNQTASASPELWVIAETNNLRIGIGTTGTHGQITGSAPINSTYVARYQYDSTGNAQMWINGVSQGTASTDGVSAAGSIVRRLGDSIGNTALLFNGYLCELIISTGVWSANRGRQMELYAGGFWGISV